ncbi:hypothetical protein AWC01_11785 [Mycobacterium doricum]|uniref:Uncharacterized protein n=2 Tax=Mycolicibacterium doricum TaxID=126673 RepID=A0A1X1T802_9MYCO|nr:hypothetical protein AWC01_11785 [Mycolicibacterium doricum]
MPARRIGGAALDVSENEPMPTPHCSTPRTSSSPPHIATAGESTGDEMGLLAVDNVAAVLAGRPALSPLR